MDLKRWVDCQNGTPHFSYSWRIRPCVCCLVPSLFVPLYSFERKDPKNHWIQQWLVAEWLTASENLNNNTVAAEWGKKINSVAAQQKLSPDIRSLWSTMFCCSSRIAVSDIPRGWIFKGQSLFLAFVAVGYQLELFSLDTLQGRVSREPAKPSRLAGLQSGNVTPCHMSQWTWATAPGAKEKLGARL